MARHDTMGRPAPSRWDRRLGRAILGNGGYSLTEMVVVCVVLTILAGISFPIARDSMRARKERELQRVLRLMRNAIDEHKRYFDAGLIEGELGSEGYPESLEVLVEGKDLITSPTPRTKIFLRRIPFDPMTGEAEWGIRGYQEGGFDEIVFDVHSESTGVGLNGIPYEEW